MVAIRVLLACTASVLVAGCGSSRHGAATRTAIRATPRTTATTPRTIPATPRTIPTTPGTIPTTPGTTTIPSPPPTGAAARPVDVAVIRAWADALRRGDVRAAARYFALPSEMINGVVDNGLVTVIRIRTVAEAEQANASLPCGARLISADVRGRYVNALFRLTGRPGVGGTNCGSGAGATARTNFVIAGHRIVKWIRAPDDPGDNGGPPSGGNGGPPPGGNGGAPAEPAPNQGPVA